MAAQKPPPPGLWQRIVGDLEDIAPFVEQNPEGISQTGAAQASAAAVGGAVSDVTAVPSFLGRLASGNLWIRAGEVAVGLILLGIGLNAMLKGKPLQVVTGAAGVAGKAAMLA